MISIASSHAKSLVGAPHREVAAGQNNKASTEPEHGLLPGSGDQVGEDKQNILNNALLVYFYQFRTRRLAKFQQVPFCAFNNPMMPR
jgi:hypothetical protein